MATNPRVRIVNIDGFKFEVDPLMLYIKRDSAEELSMAPVMVSRISEALGRARTAYNIADAEYRAWRDRMLVKYGEAKPPLAEWKAKARVGGSPRFLQHKRRIAELDGIVTELEGLLEGAKSRCNLVQSVTANLRAEFQATGRRPGLDNPDSYDSVSKADQLKRKVEAGKRRKRKVSKPAS